MKYELQQIDSNDFDLRDEADQEKDWNTIFIADSDFDLAERLIDFINDDEIDPTTSFYRVTDSTTKKTIMGVE